MQGKKKLSYEELEQVSDANYEAWRVAKADAEFLRGLLNMLDVFLDRAGVEKDNEICERIGFLVCERDGLEKACDERSKLIISLEGILIESGVNPPSADCDTDEWVQALVVERDGLRAAMEAKSQMIAFMKKSVQEHFEQLDGDDVPMFLFQ